MKLPSPDIINGLQSFLLPSTTTASCVIKGEQVHLHTSQQLPSQPCYQNEVFWFIPGKLARLWVNLPLTRSVVLLNSLKPTSHFSPPTLSSAVWNVSHMSAKAASDHVPRSSKSYCPILLVMMLWWWSLIWNCFTNGRSGSCDQTHPERQKHVWSIPPFTYCMQKRSAFTQGQLGTSILPHPWKVCSSCVFKAFVGFLQSITPALFFVVFYAFSHR